MSTVPPSVPPKRRGTPPSPAFAGATAAAHSEPATALNARRRAEAAARVQEYARQQASQAPHGGTGVRPTEPLGLAAVVSGIPMLQARMRAFDAGARAAAQAGGVGGMMGGGAQGRAAASSAIGSAVSGNTTAAAASARLVTTPRLAITPRPYEGVIVTRLRPRPGRVTHGVESTILLPRTIYYRTPYDYTNFYLGLDRAFEQSGVEAGLANSIRTGERDAREWHWFVNLDPSVSLSGQQEIYRGSPHRRSSGRITLEADPATDGWSIVTLSLDGDPVWAGHVRLDRRTALGKCGGGMHHNGGIENVGRFGPFVRWTGLRRWTVGPGGPEWVAWDARTPTLTDDRRRGRLKYRYGRSFDDRQDWYPGGGGTPRTKI